MRTSEISPLAALRGAIPRCTFPTSGSARRLQHKGRLRRCRRQRACRSKWPSLPLLQTAVAAPDDVPVPVLIRVKLRWSPACGTAARAVILLGPVLEDNSLVLASAQVCAIGPRRICLITEQRARPIADSVAAWALDSQLVYQLDEAVAVLASCAKGDRRQTMAVDKLMRLRWRSITGASRAWPGRPQLRFVQLRRASFSRCVGQ